MTALLTDLILEKRMDAVEAEMLELQKMQEDFESSQIGHFYRWVLVAFFVGCFVGILIGVA